MARNPTPPTQTVRINDADDPTRALKVNADGSINTVGSAGVASDVNITQVGGNAVPVGTAGSVPVVGNVASGATDSGNPVKVGGVYNTTPPTLTNGQRGDAQLLVDGSTRSAMVGGPQAPSDTMTNSGFAAPFVSTTQGTSNGLVTALMGYNGTNWSRIRLTGASGALLTELGPYVFGRVTADGQIKGSAGFIHTITIAPIGTTVAGVLTVYNSLTETGTVIYSTSLPVTTFTPFSITLDVAATTGIFVGFDATLANVQVTVSYR